MRRTSPRLWLIITLTIVPLGCAPGPQVVLYCAQDREFAESILADFSASQAYPAVVKYDSEANKSVALFEELVRERDRPRCDVHWNNEILATIRLQKLGLLEPYRSPNALDFPAHTRPEDGSWQAFAARARVLIVNTNLVPMNERPSGIFDMVHPKWKGRIAMAKPQFGTTATHAACLFQVLGEMEAKSFFDRLRDNDVQLVAGNKQVAERVGQGDYAFGITDTDDAMLEVNAGRPVTIIFPDADGMGTLFLPNTLALIRNGPNPERGKQLIDYLLQPEIERRLAQSGGFQIPLNPAATAALPAPLAPAATVKPMRVDFHAAADEWDRVQAFLRDRFAR